MNEYLIERLTYFPEDINGTAKTPSTKCLSKTTTNTPKLDEKISKMSHGIVQNYFMCQAHPSEPWILMYKSMRPDFG